MPSAVALPVFLAWSMKATCRLSGNFSNILFVCFSCTALKKLYICIDTMQVKTSLGFQTPSLAKLAVLSAWTSK